MNSTIETILNHRSIRKFKKEKLSTEQIQLLVKSAQQASTSSHVMAYTIIGITDEKIKKALYEVSGHRHVVDNGHLFIFCGDLHRVQLRATESEKNSMAETIESTEQFIVTIIDAALASQNLAIAAESLGLGICYLGSLRNNINAFSSILNLPDHAIPLFGIAVGYPDQQPELKPRLPMEAVYHENTYKADELQIPLLQTFDEEMKAYYKNRSTNKREDTWKQQMIKKYNNSTRMDVSAFVQSKNLNKR
ncbi:oxygen-insensitive NADPH nitroreductase [Oceanobacillus piezotolerans]|uniref:Oxygen-insensitive NADPH nitroreductase n=1 Tax=Oceanobacillus piezotolerans TaxID=2448030 RepID=A0A498D7T8_9BACI|nr:oxygen-insensitive NADPH nitroreductase [Oceanobacillus piezotolerans]RLL45516.1 oxygen-insensitive NADPH nitroreductase [Oceanobacillus piezotolerans]